MPERWSPGDSITLRYVGHSDGQVPGKPGVLQGWPYLVVADGPDLLALWMPAGTRIKRVDMADRGNRLRDHVHGEHPHDEWRRGDTLRLMPAGAAYSVWLQWSTQPPHDFLGWYVNLEAPFVRTVIGVDTTDDSLDLVVRPDLTWEWKDEHLADHWVELGVYTREETARFFETGREVIAAVEARCFPFDGSWLDWRPDPAWGIPEVHPDWDRVPGYDLPLTSGRRLTGVDHPSVC
jgi:hypothetical protein